MLTCPSNSGLIVLLLLTALAVLIALTIASPAGSEPVAGPPLEQLAESQDDGASLEQLAIEAYIKKYLTTWYKPGTGKRWGEAPLMARWIVEEARDAEVDPYALAVIIRFESGYRIEPGAGIACSLGEGKCVGERGLGQLHGMAERHARHEGCNLETPQGQLCGAAHWWRVALERCGGDELKALRAYQTGDCRIKVAGASRRYSQLLKLRKISVAMAEKSTRVF